MSLPIVVWNRIPLLQSLELHWTWTHFTSGIILKGWTNRWTNQLGTVPPIYCNYQPRQLVRTPHCWFAYNNAPSATTGINPFFANKGLSSEPHGSSGVRLGIPRALMTLSQTLRASTKQLRPHIADAQHRYNFCGSWRLPGPDSRWKPSYVKVQILHTTWPSKNYPINSLVCYKILALLAPFCHLYFPDSLQPYTGIHISSLEPANSESDSWLDSTPPPPIIVKWWTEFGKSPKSSTPRLTTNIVPASYCTWHWTGYEALTKNSGSSLPNSTCFWTHVDSNSAYPAKSGHVSLWLRRIHFNWSLIEVSKLYKSKNSFTIYSLIVESSTSLLALSPLLNSGLSFLTTHSALKSPWIPPSWGRPPVSNPGPPSTQPLHSDSTSNFTSTSFSARPRSPFSNYPAGFQFETQTCRLAGIFWAAL